MSRAASSGHLVGNEGRLPVATELPDLLGVGHGLESILGTPDAEPAAHNRHECSHPFTEDGNRET